jgi:hypothetical protein
MTGSRPLPAALVTMDNGGQNHRFDCSIDLLSQPATMPAERTKRVKKSSVEQLRITLEKHNETPDSVGRTEC